jgi:hypothetical protein
MKVEIKRMNLQQFAKENGADIAEFDTTTNMLTLFKRRENTLSDKIIPIVPMSLQYPDDGRRICELKSNSEVLCQKVKGLIKPVELAISTNSGADILYLIDIEDVKEAIRELDKYLDSFGANGIAGMVRQKTKERFGGRLL